ncbi:Ubiquitin carboxyl-terminal hydrolase CYLD [Orchesella cincta]|uniref:Ubiquitin carboxyl-terminal hydrolase CYLD n=1 Tax=Orchesella cincta TaxID=48709 RepID=A0A1D2MLE9_ORCCI|nr:Ubiquitin carboxyl-terminal hydrolase CYLD [Orchesella cincta]
MEMFFMGAFLSANKDNRFYRVQSLHSLRNKVLEYLISDRDEDYSLNPFETFSDIYYHRYSNLPDFIRDIKLESPLTIAIYRPPAKTGMRFVNVESPEERGKLVKFNTALYKDANNKCSTTACLDMDTAPKSGLSKLFVTLIQRTWILSWLFPNIGKTLRTIPVSNLELEKEHLKRLLIDSQSQLRLTCHPYPLPKTTDTSKEETRTPVVNMRSTAFIGIESDPLFTHTTTSNLIGHRKGIAGDYNSCYLDSLLVSMFYCTSGFDVLLTSKQCDSQYARTTRELLNKKIVMPLRTRFYCSSKRAMKLRSHLRTFNEDVMGSFMDVEQLVYLLLDDALKETEFIHYNEGGSDFMHLMIIDTRDTASAITVQANFEISMQLTGDLRLESVPNPGLILGLPRSNGKLVNYEAVIPSLELNIHDLMIPASCTLCKQADANWEITNKFNRVIVLPSCGHCTEEFVRDNQDDSLIVLSRTLMRLSAIICIRASHFTAFIRNTMGRNEWLFFDSMAGNGPEVKVVNCLEKWLNYLGLHPQDFLLRNEEVPYIVQRTLTDGHMCIYEPVFFQ